MNHIAEGQQTLRIRSGTSVNMTGGEMHIPSDPNNIRINNEQIQRYLKPNDVIYFDDGKVVGIVVEVMQAGVKMEIKIGG